MTDDDHKSDCATHNDPYLPRGACDCGADTRRKAAEEWALETWGWMDEEDVRVRKALADGYLAGQECGEQRAVEGICKRLRYWQKELNVAFDYAADIENGGWKL